jgi:cytochrome b
MRVGLHRSQCIVAATRESARLEHVPPGGLAVRSVLVALVFVVLFGVARNESLDADGTVGALLPS